MSEKQYDEKDEKELRKHDEKTEERDALHSIVWAAIFIWAGLAFLAANQGWLNRFGIAENSFFFNSFVELMKFNVWNVVFLGAGIIMFMEFIIRLLIPSLRQNIGGTLIVAAVFVGIGLGPLFDWKLGWPLVLIAVGINMVIKAFAHRQ